MQDKLRLAVIGAGFWGRRWVPVALASDVVELVAVVDQSEEALDTTISAFDLPASLCYRSLAEACAAAQPEAVVIIVPPKYHFAVAAEAMDRGLHILCEKPLAATMAECRQLLDRHRATDKVFMIDQNYRFRGANRAVHGEIAAGAIGKPSYIVWEFRKAMRFGGWRDEEMADVLLEDMSLHHFDLMRYFAGANCREIYARSFRPDWSWFKGNPCAAAVVTMENDVTVSYFGSWVAPGTQTSLNGRVNISGDLGTVEFDTDGSRATIMPLGGARRQVMGEWVAFPAIHKALEAFAHAVQTGETPETDIADNVQSMAMVFAALTSARTGKPVRIADIMAGR
ncbi:MAG: Gfo/Idh/MocA family protein [Chloroflexota bacterium]